MPRYRLEFMRFENQEAAMGDVDTLPCKDMATLWVDAPSPEDAIDTGQQQWEYEYICEAFDDPINLTATQMQAARRFTYGFMVDLEVFDSSGNLLLNKQLSMSDIKAR